MKKGKQEESNDESPIDIAEKLRVMLRKHILPITAILLLIVIGIAANSVYTKGVKEVDVVQKLEEIITISDPKEKYYCDWSHDNFKFNRPPTEVIGKNGEVTGYFLEMELIAPQIRERNPDPG